MAFNTFSILARAIVITLVGGLVEGCTQEKPDPGLISIQKGIENQQRKIASTEESLKRAPQGNIDSLQQEKEAAGSRLERLKELLKARKPH